MTRVPVHTNQAGSSANRVSYSSYTKPATSGQVTRSHKEDRSLSYKSENITGPYIVGTRFRLPTPYKRICVRLESAPFDYSYKALIGRTRVWGDEALHLIYFTSTGLSFTTGDVQVPSFVENRAIAEALLKVQDMKVDYGTALAEFRKSVDYLAKRMGDILFFIRLLRRGRFVEAARAIRARIQRDSRGKPFGVPKTAAQAWLEFQYALMPLIYDVYGTFELIKSGFREDDKIFKVTRTVKTPVNVDDYWSSSTTGVRHSVSSGKAMASARVVLNGRVTSPAMFALSNLGLLNPAVVAWELVPFSFVIDWLVPVGDWLQSLTATIGVDFVAGCVTRKREGYVNVRFTEKSLLNQDVVFVEAPEANFKWVGIDRRVLDSWPWALPYVKDPFSTSHVTSALALFTSLRR